ncbi:MAG: dihydroorotate dehydrogenase [Gammaproteobacteria bacterium]|nr:MAG: dihydroorotate dehydrogenase [Gammaproteobacteria bacterium]
MDIDLSVTLWGIKFKNPVWVASGTFGYGLEALDIYDVSQLGAVVLKGLSLKPREGNEPPRIVETYCGMLNAIGLQNPGVERFLKEIYPRLEKIDTHFVANIFDETEEGYEEVVKSLEGAKKIVAYELNVSCPNVKKGGMIFGHDEKLLANLIERVKKVATKPVIVKLSPNVGDIKKFARICVEAGADGISLINTILAMKINIEKMKPELSIKTGGLSGPAILPIAVRMVYQAYEEVGREVPIIGIGGISTYKDALEHILAGASAVQVGTANFYDPLSPLKILEGIRKFLKKKGFNIFTDIVGKAHGV